MRAAVIVFPGSNCDRDMAVALREATGAGVSMVWHKDTALPEGLDLVALPGGSSFGASATAFAGPYDHAGAPAAPQPTSPSPSTWR